MTRAVEKSVIEGTGSLPMPSKRSTVAWLITAECAVGCSHCILQAAGIPWKTPSYDSCKCWIEGVAESGVIQNVGITGGEPFAVYDRLLDIVSLIRSHDMHPNVLTSAHWADSDAGTEKLLRPLAQAGLEGVGVSVDEFHQSRIPIGNVRRAMRAAKRLGLWVGAAFCYFDEGRDPVTEAEEARRALREMLGPEAYEELDIINLNPVQRAGRARRDVEFPQRSVPAQRHICSALTPSIWPDGSIHCCCGPRLSRTSPLVLGNLNHDTFQEIYRRYKEHPILPFLHIQGLAAMVEELHEHGLGEGLDGLDAPQDMCRLCQKLLADERNVTFFMKRFGDPDVRRQLGVQQFLLHGDPELLLGTGSAS